MKRILGLLCFWTMTVMAQATPPPPLPEGAEPSPIDGALWVKQALNQYGIVGLSDLHGCREEHAFYMKLLSDDRVLDRVQDIVLEANSRHQGVADAYVNGGNVPREELAQIWLDTTALFTWGETPESSAILDRVREINATRAPNKRIRVVLADIAVNWSTTFTAEDREAQLADREEALFQNLDREVASKGHRAIVIMGGVHIARSPNAPFPSVLSRIEQKYPGKTRYVILHEGLGQWNERGERHLQRWEPGSIATIAGTWLANITEWGQGGDMFFPTDGGDPGELPPPTPLGQVADGYLFVSTVEGLTAFYPYPFQYRNQAWWTELKRRYQIVFGHPLEPRSELQFQPALKYYAPGVIAGIPLPPFLPPPGDGGGGPLP